MTTEAAASTLTYAVRRNHGAVVLTLHGALTACGAATVEAVLRDLIHGQGNLTIEVDLRDVSCIDPEAARVFSAAARWARGHGGCLTLRAPTQGLTTTIDQTMIVREGEQR
jgi:anti-anti-sigma factor